MLTRTLVCDSLNERYVACYLLYHKENWICKEILGYGRDWEVAPTEE